MAKPAVLIIDSSISMTGALKAIVTSARVLSESFTFHFIVPRNTQARSWMRASGVQILQEWRLIELSKRIATIIAYVPNLLNNALRLKRIVKENKIDIVHVNDLYNLIPATARLFGCRVPYVCHVRFMPERFPRLLFGFWLKVQLRYAEKVIVVSDALRKKLPRHDKIIVVYDGFPFDTESQKKELQKNEELIFLYLSNMIRGKGQDHALEAFINIRKHLAGWRLRFVGGDMGLEKNKEYLRDLKRTADISGVGGQVEWHDFTADVTQHYLSADIVLNFSESESFSMSSLEALSCGRPLIVTDCGGPSEIVQDNITGRLVPVNDIKAMERAMLELAADPTMRKMMGVKAEADMRRRFDASHTAKKLEEVYRSCLQRI